MDVILKLLDLSRTIVNDYFPGVLSKISGIGLVGIEKKIREIHKEALKVQKQYYQLGVFIDIEKMVKLTNIKANLFIYYKVQ